MRYLTYRVSAHNEAHNKIHLHNYCYTDTFVVTICVSILWRLWWYGQVRRMFALVCGRVEVSFLMAPFVITGKAGWIVWSSLSLCFPRGGMDFFPSLSFSVYSSFLWRKQTFSWWSMQTYFMCCFESKKNSGWKFTSFYLSYLTQFGCHDGTFFGSTVGSPPPPYTHLVKKGFFFKKKEEEKGVKIHTKKKGVNLRVLDPFQKILSEREDQMWNQFWGALSHAPKIHLLTVLILVLFRHLIRLFLPCSIVVLRLTFLKMSHTFEMEVEVEKERTWRNFPGKTSLSKVFRRKEEEEVQ